MKIPETRKNQPVPQPEVPMLNMVLQGVQWRVDSLPTGEKVLVLGPLAVQIVVPFDAPGAKGLSDQLQASGGIVIPQIRI